jgi:flagellar biosynthesis/type III secretory pathway protein FliH
MPSPPRILKAFAPVAGRRIEAAVWDADGRVREMVSAAREEARRLVADARAARDAVLAEAREEGRREGQASTAATLACAAIERDRLLRDAEREVVALALDVARKVLAREVGAPGAALELAAAALAEARGRREVVLRVSPSDAVAIRAGSGRLAAALGDGPLEVREDPSVAPGGAVVETEAGRIDARVESQLDAVARAIAEALA